MSTNNDNGKLCQDFEEFSFSSSVSCRDLEQLNNSDLVQDVGDVNAYLGEIPETNVTPSSSSNFNNVEDIVAQSCAELQDLTNRVSLQPESSQNLEKSNKRRRTTFTAQQVYILEQKYKSKPYLTRVGRALLARELNLDENLVKNWFQNRRSKDKKFIAKTSKNALKLEEIPSNLPTQNLPQTPQGVPATVTPISFNLFQQQLNNQQQIFQQLNHQQLNRQQLNDQQLNYQQLNEQPNQDYGLNYHPRVSGAHYYLDENQNYQASTPTGQYYLSNQNNEAGLFGASYQGRQNDIRVMHNQQNVVEYHQPQPGNAQHMHFNHFY